jgi:hypothetical protein
MEFIINGTNERKELHYIDARTGVDCINDVIGNSGAIGDYITYDEDAGVYRINQEDYEWWDEYITYAQEDAEELARLREELDQRDEYTGQYAIDGIVSRNYAPIDMDAEHSEWQRVFDIIREALGK